VVASEVTPWAKTGGLADVTGSLPQALEDLGHHLTVILPRYRGIDTTGCDVVDRHVTLGALVTDVRFHIRPLSERRRVVFVDSPAQFDRPGLYATEGRDFADNADRFALLAAGALEFATAHGAAPDVIHAHDWQTGLVSVLARSVPRYREALSATALVFTVHNLTYQGVFDRDVVPRLGLPWSVFRMETGEFWGRFSFLKAGLTTSDVVTTVSPTYASETLGAETGAGLDGVLRTLGDRYVGILNGIDTRVWDPAADPLIPAPYDVGNLDGKAACKRALLARFNLPLGDDALARPVVAMVSRLVAQKGLELVRAAADELAGLDATWIFVGAGDETYERFLTELAERFPSRVAVHVGFDEALAHLVEAGADLFVMPSVFEPCGLNQMYSLRYGTVPVVTAVGGLDDTVQPYTIRARHANGFKFRDQSVPVFVRTMRQALRLYHDKAAWRPLMERGMAADHSWQTSAREYVKVYRRARRLAPAREGL
jgi:starch synthase